MRLPPIPLWTPKWSQEILAETCSRNPRAFARGFRMQAYSDEELLFPSFKSCYTPGIVVGDIIRRGWPTYIGVDLAGDKRPGNVIFVLAVDPTNRRRYPVEIIYGAWTSPETAAQIAGVAQRHSNIRLIFVENNAYQNSLIDWIRHAVRDHSGFWYKVEGYTTGRQKSDPQYGMPSMEVEFKNRAWTIPMDEFAGHQPNCLCGWCLWTREMTTYPHGASTDSCMAAWFAREAAEKYAPTAGSGKGLGDFNAR